MSHERQYTEGDVPVEKVLDGARGCSVVLVLGYGALGELYAACSTGDSLIIMGLLDRFSDAVEEGRYG